MKPRFFLFINGICDDPRRRDSWQDRAVEWIHDYTTDRADKFEYLALPLTRWIGQAKRIRDCAALLQRHFASTDDRIVVVAHSNGCPIALETLRSCPDLHVEALHLIAAAADSDSRRNGINEICSRGQVRSIHLYCSRSDQALKYGAGLSRILVGSWTRLLHERFGFFPELGYGQLGYYGPEAGSLASDVYPKIFMEWRNGFNHSTWFEPAHFDDTMELITRAEAV
jgi:predicted alpha/beta hydrolase family esterase